MSEGSLVSLYVLAGGEIGMFPCSGCRMVSGQKAWLWLLGSRFPVLWAFTASEPRADHSHCQRSCQAGWRRDAGLLPELRTERRPFAAGLSHQAMQREPLRAQSPVGVGIPQGLYELVVQ